MARETSVVTPQRFSEGFDYLAYMKEIKVNKARFEGFYDGCQISDADVQAFRDLVARDDGPKKMLVLGEDWCGDVIRGLPVLAAFARPLAWICAFSPETSTTTS